jgi:heat shock protein HslJ
MSKLTRSSALPMAALLALSFAASAQDPPTQDAARVATGTATPRSFDFQATLAGRAARVTSGRSARQASLENTNWNLARMAGKDVAASDAQRIPYIFLDPAGDRLSGSGGCNRLSGTYRLDKQTIRFGPTGLTMMACPTGMDREKDFMEALGATRQWKIQAHELEFYDQDSKFLLRFEAAETK